MLEAGYTPLEIVAAIGSKKLKLDKIFGKGWEKLSKPDRSKKLTKFVKDNSGAAKVPDVGRKGGKNSVLGTTKVATLAAEN